MLPDVYYYNPTCEYAVANGTVSWQPNRLLQKMEADLASLPVFFSKPGDFVLVNKKPSAKFIYSLENIGIKNRRFVTYKEAFSEDFISNKKLNNLLPWGWSPATHHFLKPLKKICSYNFSNGFQSTWDEDYKTFSGKNQSLKLLRKVVSKLKSEFLIPEEKIGIKCDSFEKVETAKNQWGKIMVKAPWSTSGRGLQPVKKSPIHTSVKQRIQGMIKEQGFVIVEPFLNKVMDVAFQFKSEKGDIDYLGTSFFKTDEKGQYQGNYLNGYPEVENQWFQRILESTRHIIPVLKEVLLNEDFTRKHEGFFGIDTLVYLNENGELKINPCLEINLRYNMGILSFYLEKYILPDVKGVFKTYYNREVSFKKFSEKMQKKHPLKISNSKIESGYFPLTDQFINADFGAFILID